ncbi:sentrin-specific protease [Elysia marginata]|uniref:Sentrin-specific protease n=1 Tax=Elysia marginata TaxID=1093978 RepID=A0AAV4FMZ2_9GAST|nr:sentrin-specific protease [Elysia marginata]
MFKSLTDGFRSFWSPSADEFDVDRVPTGSKRKINTSDRSDENGKRRKLDSQASSSTIKDYIRHSMTRMADWIRPRRKPFSEDFETRPRYRADHGGKTSMSQENGPGSHRNINHVSSVNSEGMRNHIDDFCSSGPKFNDTSINSPTIHKRKDSFTRRPSESSMFGHKKQSMANESLRLREREQYRQLLQLHSQRSPWQVHVPLNPPGERSSSFPSSSEITSKYSRPPDSINGFFQSRLDVAEELKKSAMSSLLRKQRSGLGLPATSSSSSSSSARQATISHVRPHEAPQQHLRSTQDLNAQFWRTPRHKGGSLTSRNLVLKDGERSRDLSMVGDNITDHGDTHKAGNKINGDANWEERHGTLQEGDTIIIDDEEEDEKTEQRVPPVKLSHSGPQELFSLDSSKFQACFKKCQAYSQEKDRRRTEIEEEEMKAKAYEKKRRLQTLALERQMKYQMKIFDELPEVVEDIFVSTDEDDDEIEDLPELTGDMMNVVNGALRPGNPNDVLSDAFRLQITRRDMATLAGLNWLNDEVINFYMNMLMERGEKEGQAKVYAFNTFFYPKIMSGGHAAVKRWTKKVDIFSVHFILIPVHLGMHWCLCVVDMHKKRITYYDSMGAENNQCLQAVLNYINDESVAKKQTPIKKSDWTLINEEDNPQQLNGSDCGMFMCKYAEYITRQRDLTFTQENMPYFRKRMVYEIISKKLLQ